MSKALVKTAGTTGAIAESTRFSLEEVNLIKDTVANGLGMDEFKLFCFVASSRGLNPLNREIYAVKRSGKVAHQTGIDGFRKIAQRTGQYRGQVGPYWCGKDGQWSDVWLGNGPPFAAKVGVIRDGHSEPIFSVARWSSYGANAQGPVWRNMPDHMLAKCAEALSLRRAFPDDLAGLYTSDEMAQADGERSGGGTRQKESVPYMQRLSEAGPEKAKAKEPKAEPERLKEPDIVCDLEALEQECESIAANMLKCINGCNHVSQLKQIEAMDPFLRLLEIQSDEPESNAALHIAKLRRHKATRMEEVSRPNGSKVQAQVDGWVSTQEMKFDYAPPSE